MTLSPPATRNTPPSTSRAAVETHAAIAASLGSVQRCRLGKRSPRPIHQQSEIMFERRNRRTRGPEHNPGVATEPDDLRRVPYLIASAGKPLHALNIHPDLARGAF